MEIDKVALIYIKDRKVLSSINKNRELWYLPGGKRDGNETDQETLIREVKEELDVDIIPDSIAYFETFRAQADPFKFPQGVEVKMSCYTAEFRGTPVASSEIEKIAYFEYADHVKSSPVDVLIFQDLLEKGLID